MKKILFTALGAMLFYSCSTEPINEENITSKAEVIESTNNKAVTANGTTTITEQWGTYQDPNYQWAFVNNNIWNLGDSGADPDQFIWYNNIGSWGVQAHCDTGDESYSDVKSYPSIVFGRHYNNTSQNLNGFPKKVKNLKNYIPVSWKVRVEDEGPGAKYNASFDIWFHDSPTSGRNDYEIMIWTMRKGQWPINENNDINQPWKKNQWVAGERYDVYKGTINGDQKVLTFIQRNGGWNGPLVGTKQINGNLKAFINKAVNWGWMSDNLYITSAQAGFEICTAGTPSKKANFVTDSFYLGL